MNVLSIHSSFNLIEKVFISTWVVGNNLEQVTFCGQCIIKFAILKRKSHRDSEMVSCSKNKPKGVLPRWPTIRIP